MEIKKICRDCRYYNALYTKCIYKFERQDVGLCIQKQNVVQKTEQCELYKNRKKSNKIVTLNHIDIVVSDVEKLEKLFYKSNF